LQNVENYTKYGSEKPAGNVYKGTETIKVAVEKGLIVSAAGWT
jgi:hypothetical protein